MESGDSSYTSRNKIDSRWVWTKDEKEVMLNILDVAGVKSSWANNDTFKSRNYKYIENELEKLIPG